MANPTAEPRFHDCVKCHKRTVETVGSLIDGKWYCFTCAQKMLSGEAPTSNPLLQAKSVYSSGGGGSPPTVTFIFPTLAAADAAHDWALKTLGGAAETSARKCEWGFDAGDDVWHTGCGEMWRLTCNDLHANGLKFCPCCGHEVDDLSRAAVKTGAKP